MRIEFTKMQAAGNDYILMDAFKNPGLIENAPRLSKIMSDRHFGIGGDGIILAAPSEKADLKMRMFNADGSEAEMCGNGIRQLALFAFKKGLSKKLDLDIETLCGIRHITIAQNTDGAIGNIQVDMGKPVLEPKHIPAAAELNKKGYSQIDLTILDRKFLFTLVSMGNPHAVTVIDDVGHFEVEKYGKVVENRLDVFPGRTNVEFIQLVSPGEIKMRVWERGSGETLACGTGACASVVSCVLNSQTGRKVLVHLPGGDLTIEWPENGSVYLNGSAQMVFDGIFNTAD